MFLKLKETVKTSNALLFIVIAFSIQFFYLLSFKSFDSPNTSGLYFLRGDGLQYVNYCENFYLYGEYFEGTKTKIFSYINRTPGMCVVYLPFRLFLNKENTLNAIVLFQVLLASISSYVIALMALKLIKKNIAFYIAFFLYATGMYCANFNHRLYTESLGLSTLIFSLYFLKQYIDKQRAKDILWFSLFLIWCMFLRPFIAVFVILSILYFFYRLIIKSLSLKHFIVFITPIVIIWGSWTYRNYKKTEMFLPLQSGWYNGEEPLKSQYMFIRTFGMMWPWWSQESEHAWFMEDVDLKSQHITRPNDSIFQKDFFSRHIFAGNLTIDSLKRARNDCWQSSNSKLTQYQRDSFSRTSTRMFNTFINVQKTEHPFYFYFGYRLKLAYKLLNQAHGASVRSFKYPLNVVLMFFDAIVNHFILLFGSFSMFLFLFKRKIFSHEILLMTLIPAFLVTYFSFYLRVDENRFITLGIPFFMLCGIQGLMILNEMKYKFFYFSFLGLGLISLGFLSVLKDINW